ncbi:MAG: hypothetical protein ACRDK2_16220, partial [Solirubrobacteraceae bacterium]
SEIERFISEALERTTLELLHRNLEGHSEGWEASRTRSAATAAGTNIWQPFAEVLSRASR